MIGVGVHIYILYVFICIYVCGPEIFESYFSDRLTFSNIRGTTSRRIYRLSTTAFSRNAFLIEQIKDFLKECAPCSICPDR